MQREAVTAPIENTLDYLCELASLRLHKREAQHPLCLRIKKAHTSSKPSRLEKIAKICPVFTQTSNLLLKPEPWEPNLQGGTKECIAATGEAEDKKASRAEFQLMTKHTQPE